MMKYWFTSDCHFGHANIIKYTKRPFKTLDEMNSAIIRNWNSRVKPEDTVFHIGDFCFCKGTQGSKEKAIDYEKQLNGKIIFIKGNHDHTNTLNAIIENMEITHGGINMFMTHNPDDFDCSFNINLCGHVHEIWKSKKVINHGLESVIINVGVDVNNFYPVSIEEIIKEDNIRLKK